MGGVWGPAARREGGGRWGRKHHAGITCPPRDRAARGRQPAVGKVRLAGRERGRRLGTELSCAVAFGRCRGRARREGEVQQPQVGFAGRRESEGGGGAEADCTAGPTAFTL